MIARYKDALSIFYTLFAMSLHKPMRQLNRETLKQELMAIAGEIASATYYLDLFEELVSQLESAPQLKNQTPHVWDGIRSAFEVSCMMHLAKAYDCQPTAVSLPNWLRRLRSSTILDLDRAAIEVDLHQVQKSTNPLVDRLDHRRKKFYAHCSFEHASGDRSMFADAPKDNCDLRALLATAQGIVNRYVPVFDIHPSDFDTSAGTNELAVVFTLLRIGLDRHAPPS